ncbi:hypothetical protein F5B21DRAFT_313496 [Xylaria acuta]|nr:hypothetical protein F5B21DRAFT_313496 [Xylaria acuta]
MKTGSHNFSGIPITKSPSLSLADRYSRQWQHPGQRILPLWLKSCRRLIRQISSGVASSSVVRQTSRLTSRAGSVPAALKLEPVVLCLDTLKSWDLHSAYGRAGCQQPVCNKCRQ